MAAKIAVTSVGGDVQTTIGGETDSFFQLRGSAAQNIPRCDIGDFVASLASRTRMFCSA